MAIPAVKIVSNFGDGDSGASEILAESPKLGISRSLSMNSTTLPKRSSANQNIVLAGVIALFCEPENGQNIEKVLRTYTRLRFIQNIFFSFFF